MADMPLNQTKPNTANCKKLSNYEINFYTPASNP